MQVNNMEIVRDYYRAIDRGDLEKAGQYLADDFRKMSAVSGPLSKSQSLAILRQMLAAMPDLKHNLSNLSMDGPVVTVTVQAGGRHMAPLDLAGLGIGINEGTVAPSGRMIIFLPDAMKYTVVNGKIMLEDNITPPKVYNGINGFLQAIGYDG